MAALRGVNILEKDYLVVPIHQTSPLHFFLAIVVQSRDEGGKVTSQISIFNSSRDIVKEKTVVKHISSYLSQKALNKNVLHENKPARYLDVTQQVSGSNDCGLMTCEYFVQFFKNWPAQDSIC